MGEVDTVETGSEVAVAFALVTAAGLATTIGASAVFFPCLIRAARLSVLAVALSFSAGVMVYVSFVEILGKSVTEFENSGLSEGLANLFALMSFIAGLMFMAVLEVVVHGMNKALPKLSGRKLKTISESVLAEHHDHPDDVLRSNPKPSFGDLPQGKEKKGSQSKVLDADVGDVELGEQNGVTKTEGGEGLQNEKLEGSESSASIVVTAGPSAPEAPPFEDLTHQKKLHKMGCMTALSIALHNFPEGLATFVATLSSPSVGVALAVAIGVHNIPEGLCVSVPLYYSTRSRLKAFLWGSLSGISEPIGAFLGWVVLISFMRSEVYAVIFGLVAGMMVFISIHELLPTALDYAGGRTYIVTTSAGMGMGIMGLSLVLFLL